jgi:trans-aconitate 2-methyltransferase
MWDPAQYLRFGDERSRPFFDLVGRIGAQRPALVVDLGCGPGQLTAALAARWPDAEVHGIDSSAEMIASARQLGPDATAPGPRSGDAAGRLSFAQGDVRDWQPGRPVDVLVSNAVLQWVPGHEKLLPRWVATLAPGGWLAFQLPGNFDQPSHVILRELAGSGRWRSLLAGVALNRQGGDPAGYVDLLGRAGCSVDAWETTYQHVLPGEDPVLEWTRGTALRPVLAALDPRRGAAFQAEYGERLREAYPRQPYGTVLPFRRVFVVARRDEDPAMSSTPRRSR